MILVYNSLKKNCFWFMRTRNKVVELCNSLLVLGNGACYYTYCLFIFFSGFIQVKYRQIKKNHSKGFINI